MEPAVFAHVKTFTGKMLVTLLQLFALFKLKPVRGATESPRLKLDHGHTGVLY